MKDMVVLVVRFDCRDSAAAKRFDELTPGPAKT